MKKKKTWLWILGIVIVLPIVLILTLGIIPAPVETPAPEDYDTPGARTRSDATSGLDIDFPEIVTLADNPTGNPAREQLGYLLFFDPVLSANDDISCATCHHPDLGFADGRPLPIGAGGTGVGPARSGGEMLSRHTPSLYEVAYDSALFWDGNASNLETQPDTPLFEANEMGTSREEIVADLSAIPEYVELFAAAFPDDSDPVTYQNVALALAAFQRTLTAHNSPFDAYAAGNLSALTASQKRGLALFRSGATGCYRCHAAPTFNDGEFNVTGVPNGDAASDFGRANVTGDSADEHAFKTPSLRNVALTAPYMHNGSLATLEEVLLFYANGGGEGAGLDLPNQSRFVAGFDLNPQEMQDMIDFLYALTDESTAPPIPDSVPSGLPVVPPLENPVRDIVAETNVGGLAVVDREPTTLTVTPGVTIQSVVDTAISGDVIEIEYGIYHENVVIDLSDITIRGIPNAEGEWPVLDGEGNFADGIAVSGNNFVAEFLAIKNYNNNGIFLSDVTGIVLRDLYIENTGVYGLYPVHCTDVLIERSEATGISDAGIYVGQSRNVVIRDSVAYGNVIGIEVENTINAEVYNNHTYNNTTGLFFDLLPQLDAKVALDMRVYDNITEDNNLVNFASPDMIASILPPGTGILVLGVDDIEIYNNTIRNNNSAGLTVFSTTVGFPPEDIDILPNPERVYAHDNIYENNGTAPDPFLTELGVEGSDIIWDASNWDQRFDDEISSSFPPALPSSSWPDWLKKAYWQILNFLITRLL